jgi:predicted small integral membrane protein
MTFSVSSYTASSINGAENNTILSVSNLTTKEANSRPDIQALSLGVGWLLNYTAANLPVQSSVTFGFWIAGSDSYQTFWKADAYRMLKSIIAFILWEFTANNNGNPAVANAEPSGQTLDLPAEFNVIASISRPFTRFIINRASYIAYIVLQSVALIPCWIAVVWGFMIHRRMPATTFFPLVDFEVNLRQMRSYNKRPFSDIRTGDKEERIKHVLQGVRVTSHCKERPENVSI